MVVPSRTAETFDDPIGVSPLSRDEAWALAGRLSPRTDIRVAARDASGEILNEYDRVWPLDETAPSTTWAMFLADSDHRYRYLCFDFDVSQGNAALDAGKLSLWLDDLNIPHLVCISGHSGGRHVWVRLGDPAEARAVRELAVLAKQLLPSLDRQPLVNPATGCVRPPYAPHRVAGYSQPTGTLTILDREAPEDAVENLTKLFGDLGAELPPAETSLPHGVTVDADGKRRIRGPKRTLSARMDAILHGPAEADASHTLAHVLIAAADARWSYSDVRAAAATAAGLEHARSRRVGGVRRPRTPEGTEKVLTAAWAYAVHFVATNPRSTVGDDPEYRQRMNSVIETVSAALGRADALPGLWATGNRRVGGSHAQRAVLDALCLYMLQSSQTVVEADVRRLAMDTGYGRTSVSTALRALAAEGAAGPAWIERVGTAEGVNAQRYRLHPRFSTENYPEDRTQARMRAEPEPHAPTQALIRTIATRLELLAHDVFCAPRSLGRTSGLIFKTLPEEGSATLNDLVLPTGIDPDELRRRVKDLSAAGLIIRDAGGWRRHSPTVRDFAARQFEVNGYLELRRAGYEEERKVWAWWLAEVTWMEKPNKRRRGRKPPKGAWYADADRPDYAAFPRGPDRRADFRKAAELVRAGYLDRGFALVA